jgi:hypothetical protein
MWLGLGYFCFHIRGNIIAIAIAAHSSCSAHLNLNNCTNITNNSPKFLSACLASVLGHTFWASICRIRKGNLHPYSFLFFLSFLLSRFILSLPLILHSSTFPPSIQYTPERHESVLPNLNPRPRPNFPTPKSPQPPIHFSLFQHAIPNHPIAVQNDVQKLPKQLLPTPVLAKYMCSVLQLMG